LICANAAECIGLATVSKALSFDSLCNFAKSISLISEYQTPAILFFSSPDGHQLMMNIMSLEVLTN